MKRRRKWYVVVAISSERTGDPRDVYMVIEAGVTDRNKAKMITGSRNAAIEYAADLNRAEQEWKNQEATLKTAK